MKLSQILFPSLKEIPKEATVKSHILMLRAGLIRKLASGLYSYYPLGLRAFRKVENIIRSEMNKAGAQEFGLPILIPAELWQKSGRWDQYGAALIRIKDRNDASFVLGPTHEEVFTDVAHNELFSYKDLPVTFYQIKTKFRDETRPRFGVMRGREFTMKDAYSFDLDDASLAESYGKMRQAYINIFNKCGLAVKIVNADTGAMGGSDSEEFMVESEVGEDVIVSCPSPACGYYSNLEKAEADYAYTVSQETEKAVETIDTPAVKTIEQLTAFLKCGPEIFIKTIIYKHETGYVAALIRGDLEINEVKLLNALGGGLMELAAPADIVKLTGAPVGFAGPKGLAGLRIIADESIRGMKNAVSGANAKDKHLRNINHPRDFSPEKFADIRNVKEGDKCPKCGAPLRTTKGIEVGHIFKLGQKYTKSLGVAVQGSDGKETVPTMGCYGIGVDRTLAAVVEQYNDADGICFPVTCAPFTVIIVPVDFNEPEQQAAALKLHGELEQKGIDVLVDDRDQRAGVKFKDADLLGIPVRVTIGPKFLKEGKSELRIRKTKEVSVVALDSMTDTVCATLTRLTEELK